MSSVTDRLDGTPAWRCRIPTGTSTTVCPAPRASTITSTVSARYSTGYRSARNSMLGRSKARKPEVASVAGNPVVLRTTQLRNR